MSFAFETWRLGIRPWREDEFESLASLLQDPEVMQHFPEPFRDEWVQEWLDTSVRSWAEHGYGRAAIVDRMADRIVGDVGFFKTKIEDRPVTDLGYIFHTDAQGKGFATEAALAFLGWGTDILRLDDTVVHMPEDHTASRRVAERLKMRFKRSFVNPKNRNKTHRIYVP